MAELRSILLRRTAAAALALSLGAPALVLAGDDPPVMPLPEPAEKTEPARQAAPLTAELMYRLLIGDIALQRGEPVVAARAYLEAARESRDPQLARRATEIAIAARQRAIALDAAKLWSSIEPGAERPKQVIAAAGNVASGKGVDIADTELKAQIEKALAQAAASGPALGEAFLQLNQLLAQEPDRDLTYRLVVSLAAPYPNIPEAHYAVAVAAYNTGMKDLATRAAAIKAVDRALALKPNWERGTLLKSEILAKDSPAAATEYLVGALKADPNSKPLWGALAQLYVEQKRYADARAVFERLWEQDKNAREYEFGVAALSVQMKDWPRAEELLQDLKNARYGENGVVEFYLAQVAEEQNRYELAIERYRAVPEGERQWLGQLRIAAMMAKMNKLAEARDYLRALPAVTIDQKIQVRQTEAQLLRDAGDNAAAFTLLTQALSEHPDDPDLLYDAAMAAEKIDNVEASERHLRRLLELSPDNSQALNALGYTLVDRTKRLEEGYALIEKALKLSPDDPFIQDSMGWALYRMGRLEEAEKYLRRALAEKPDAEIAAHLGEVLWVRGDRVAAQEVWQSQLKTSPDNQVLLNTVRRLAP